MPIRLSSLTLRSRLIVLGGGAGATVLVLTVATALLMSGIGSQTSSSTAKQQQAQTLSHAYESWITNDDQNNMYVSLLALRDPAQQKLADTTWGQAVAAYQDARGQLVKLRGVLRDPREAAELSSIETALAGYNSFSLQVRQAAQSGNVTKAVQIQAVSNSAVSAALVGGFASLRAALERNAAQNASAVQSSVSSATVIVLVIAGVTLPLLLLILITTIRSIITGVKHIQQRLDNLSHAMELRLKVGLQALANGDFTRHLGAVTKPEHIQRHDELSEILRTAEHIRDTIIACYDSYNASTQTLRDTLTQVTSTAISVDSTSREMATSSEESGRATAEIAQAIEHVAHGAERQVRAIATARSAAAEVATAVSASAEEAQQANEVASRARETAQQGVTAAEQANAAMRSVKDSSENVTTAIRELAAKSDQIGQIVQTITGIAEQTNLLALSAAIEAARAGGQGRGFAVVADEVRKLAEESQRAAQEISGLIIAIQSETAAAVDVVEDGAKKTADGANVVEQAREAFLSIGQAVEDMGSRVERIAAAAQQITTSAATMQASISKAAAVAEESSASTEQVSASTQETSASTEHVAASAAEMASNAETLRELVGHFQLNADAPSPPK